MRQMEDIGREIEVKLPYASVADARRALTAIGAETVRERHFEDNALFDRNGELKDSKRLVRVRRVDGEAWVTFKGPTGEEPGRHRVRVEHETAVGDGAVMHRILDGVGFAVSYRYQKYRTLFRLGELVICLDETPIGCFVELEGAPDDIDSAAAALGFSSGDYITASYRELHREEREAGRYAGRDMVFEARERTDE